MLLERTANFLQYFSANYFLCVCGLPCSYSCTVCVFWGSNQHILSTYHNETKVFYFLGFCMRKYTIDCRYLNPEFTLMSNVIYNHVLASNHLIFLAFIDWHHHHLIYMVSSGLKRFPTGPMDMKTSDCLAVHVGIFYSANSASCSNYRLYIYWCVKLRLRFFSVRKSVRL